MVNKTCDNPDDEAVSEEGGGHDQGEGEGPDQVQGAPAQRGPRLTRGQAHAARVGALTVSNAG